MILTSISYLIENIKKFIESARVGEVILAEDAKNQIVLVRRDKIERLK